MIRLSACSVYPHRHLQLSVLDLRSAPVVLQRNWSSREGQTGALEKDQLVLERGIGRSLREGPPGSRKKDQLVPERKTGLTLREGPASR